MRNTQKTVSEILESLCDCYYIYGEDRSRFMCWTSEMQSAIMFDSNYFDKSPPEYIFRGFNREPLHGHYFFIKQTLNEMIKDINELGHYKVSDPENLIKRCCTLFKAAWKRKCLTEFKEKLSGKRTQIFRDW